MKKTAFVALSVFFVASAFAQQTTKNTAQAKSGKISEPVKETALPAKTEVKKIPASQPIPARPVTKTEVKKCGIKK